MPIQPFNFRLKAIKKCLPCLDPTDQKLYAPLDSKMSTDPKLAVLILCTGNSCRSHMAEGILRAAAGDLLDVHSAGSDPVGYVHPLAVKVLSEIGIDISAHTSKHMNDFLEQRIDVVVTVCGNAEEACPTYPGQLSRYHWGFDDPAKADGSESEIWEVFVRVRNEIKLVFEAYAAGYCDAQREGK
jgi:arsenate reductase